MTSGRGDDCTTESWTLPGWEVAVRADIGGLRSEMQDAWALADDVAMPNGATGFVVGVFDGLGGVANGALAATTAADTMTRTLAAETYDQALIQRLDEAVVATRGATTAALLGLPHIDQGSRTDPVRDGAIIRTIGDSSVYGLGDYTNGLVRLNPMDRVSRNVVSDFLGRGKGRGHEVVCDIAPETTFLVCSDGVDGVVDRRTLEAALRAPSGRLEEALSHLFEAVFQRGAPDNATAFLVRRVQ